MSEENNKPKKLSLSGSGKLSLGGGAVDPASLRGGMVGSDVAKQRSKYGVNALAVQRCGQQR